MCLNWCFYLNSSSSSISKSDLDLNNNNSTSINKNATNNTNNTNGAGSSTITNSNGGKQKLDGSNFLDHVTPGAFSFITQMHNPKSLSEQLTLDLNELKKQYKKLKERQRQAQIIIQTASAQHRLKSAAASASANGGVGTSNQSSQSPSLSNARKEMSGGGAGHHHQQVMIDTSAMSPFSLEQAPIINHLLIKPSDLNRNTLKQTIKLSSSATPVTMASVAASNSDELIIDQNLAEKINHSKVNKRNGNLPCA